MSVDLMVRANMTRPDKSVSATALNVWRWMAWRAEDDGTVAKSRKSIACDLHYAQSTVQCAFDELEEQGLITTLKPSSGRLPTVYRVEIEPTGYRSVNRPAVRRLTDRLPTPLKTEEQKERGAAAAAASYSLSRARS